MLSKQHGATLITALIMLIVLTLLVVSGIRSSSTNLRIAGNMQMQEAAAAAAQQAIENVISTDALDASPQTVGDFNVMINTPICLSATALVAADGRPEDCQAEAGMDICFRTTWQITATAIDPNTGATAVITQGVAMMANSDQTDTNCAQVKS